MTPRRRCQPGSGATRAEPVFPTKREGPARGRRRHAVAAEALVPPGAARVAIRVATRVATVYTNAPKRLRGGHFHRFVYTPASPRLSTTAQQCTQTLQSGAERTFSAICVHYCVLASAHDSATVYTNAPIRRGEARSSHLCTLLRSQDHPRPKPTAQQCTQMP